MMRESLDKPVLARGLTKVFADFWNRPKVRAVDGLDLELRKGEIFGLLGPNGSGKSTTIKMILGLLHPTGGEVEVFGLPPANVRAKRLTGYLPEESYLYPYLTPRETLDMMGSIFNLPSAERRRRSEQLLEMVGLSAAADRPVGEFSKGMARRIGLAQALVNNPSLVILDEPTSGLDPIACRHVKDLTVALARSGKTVLLSSHLLADVEDVCDRVAILFNGRVRARGTLTELLEKRNIVRFAVPDPGSEAVARISGLVRELSGREPQIDHPSMDLEDFFLDVIAKASREGETLSGAAPTCAPAPFLLE